MLNIIPTRAFSRLSLYHTHEGEALFYQKAFSMPIDTLRASVSSWIHSKLYLILFIISIPYVEPQLFKTEGFSSLDSLYAALKLLCALVAIALYIYIVRRPSKLMAGMLAIQIWIGLSTLVCHGSISRFAGPAITAVVSVAVIECALRTEFKAYVVLMRDLLSLFVLINFITILLSLLALYPFKSMFLGIDNRWVYFFLPWITFAFLYRALSPSASRWFPWAVYCVSLVSLIGVWSTGAVLALTVWPVIWSISYIYRKKKGAAASSGALAVFLSAAIANIALLSGAVLSLLNPILKGLGKDVTLAGRTFLWDGALASITRSPLFGAGVQSEQFDKDFFFSCSPGLPWTRVNHPHNMFLNVAYHGGLPAGIGFALLCGASMLRLNQCRGTQVCITLLCAMAAFLTASLVDTLDFGPLFQIIAMTYFSSDIVLNSEDKRPAYA